MFSDIDQQLCDTLQQNIGFRHSLPSYSYVEKELTDLQNKVDHYLYNAYPGINIYSF